MSKENMSMLTFWTSAENPAKSLLGSKPTTGCLVSILVLTICLIAICTLSVLYLQKQESNVKSTITLQVGGLGRKLSKKITELHRPLTPECKDDHLQISDLPISLRAHVAIELDGLGVLVCGGVTEVIGQMSGIKVKLKVTQYIYSLWKIYKKVFFLRF